MNASTDTDFVRCLRVRIAERSAATYLRISQQAEQQGQPVWADASKKIALYHAELALRLRHELEQEIN